jgi:hypothetical protein
MSTPTRYDAYAELHLQPREGEDTLISIIEELSCWPPGTTVDIKELAARLRPLIGREGLDAQQVAWTLDVDGRYWRDPLSPELGVNPMSPMGRFQCW